MQNWAFVIILQFEKWEDDLFFCQFECVLKVNADVKKEVENCSKVESEEHFAPQEREPSSREGAGEEKNQATEGSHIEKEDMLDKSKKELLSKKPVHSIFGKYSNTLLFLQPGLCHGNVF